MLPPARTRYREPSASMRKLTAKDSNRPDWSPPGTNTSGCFAPSDPWRFRLGSPRAREHLAQLGQRGDVRLEGHLRGTPVLEHHPPAMKFHHHRAAQLLQRFLAHVEARPICVARTEDEAAGG